MRHPAQTRPDDSASTQETRLRHSSVSWFSLSHVSRLIVAVATLGRYPGKRTCHQTLQKGRSRARQSGRLTPQPSSSAAKLPGLGERMCCNSTSQSPTLNDQRPLVSIQVETIPASWKRERCYETRRTNPCQDNLHTNKGRERAGEEWGNTSIQCAHTQYIHPFGEQDRRSISSSSRETSAYGISGRRCERRDEIEVETGETEECSEGLSCS